jgi:hypothetical protein
MSDAVFAQSMPLVLANLERFGFQELLLRFLIRSLRDRTSALTRYNRLT